MFVRPGCPGPSARLLPGLTWAEGDPPPKLDPAGDGQRVQDTLAEDPPPSAEAQVRSGKGWGRGSSHGHSPAHELRSTAAGMTTRSTLLIAPGKCSATSRYTLEARRGSSATMEPVRRRPSARLTLCRAQVRSERGWGRGYPPPNLRSARAALRGSEAQVRSDLGGRG